MDWKSTDFYCHELWIVNFIMHTYKYGHWNTVHTCTQTLHVPQTCLSPPEWYLPNWRSLWTLEANKAPQKRKTYSLEKTMPFLEAVILYFHPCFAREGNVNFALQVPFGWWHRCRWCYVSWCRNPLEVLAGFVEVTKSKWSSHESTILYNESQKPFGEMQEFSLFTVEGSLLKYCSWNHMQT